MNVGNRRPGTSTTFVDATSEETILQLAADEDGLSYMAFHLYDGAGSFVAGSSLEHFEDGVTIRSDDGEVLLLVPKDPWEGLRYKLYNGQGTLLTASDGSRTMIYQLLRMEGVKRDWTPPSVVGLVPLRRPLKPKSIR